MNRNDLDVGILTFHCSDNFGAMLQAYGLRQALHSHGIRAGIVRYEPPFLTGRHWFAPYVPPHGNRGYRRSAAILCFHTLAHLRAPREFFLRRQNMRRFRMKYLVDKASPRSLFLPGLWRLSFRCYIVGSDQIWNPEITCGLRKAYFGAFKNKRKERVVAYAASLGGANLPSQYDRTFSNLLRHLDAVSVREEGAISYIRRFWKGDVTAVLDPVFLLGSGEWEKIEIPPAREKYILVSCTERNPSLLRCARELSQRTGLPVVELRDTPPEADAPFSADCTAGPAEFLGYVRRADYVLSNSFHAAAFSIIFEKRFLAFAHSSFNARLQSVLRIHGLEGRLCTGDTDPAVIDTPVDWEAVRERTRSAVEKSEAFLFQNAAEGMQ